MFRKSLQILFATALLALASTVGYALLRLRGAEDTLRDAEAGLAAGRFAQVIDDLNMCEGAASLRRDRTLRHRLWRLRLRAYSALDNPRGALLDVEHLLEDGLADDEELQLERIRLLVAAEDGERALKLARTFLATHPDHARALELAGEACRVAAKDPLDRLGKTIARDLGTVLRQRADGALRLAMYCPDGDPEVARNFDVLAALYAAEARLSSNWAPLLRDLRAIRELLQEGLGYTTASLAVGGEPVEAQRTIAAAFDAAERPDELLVQCEIYRRRFDNEHVSEAGNTAAWALVRRGAHGAALATAERWLPSAALARRLQAGTLGDAATDLLLARIVAAWRLDDRASLGRLYPDFLALQRAEVDAPVPRHLLIGLLHSHKQENKHAEGNLRYVTDLLLRTPVPAQQVDLLPELVPLRLELLRQGEGSDAAALALMNSWVKARPDDPRPTLAFARFLLASGRLPAAHDLLGSATRSDPGDEELFHLHLATHSLVAQQSGQGGDALLAQCLRRRSATPEVTNPMDYLLCAQAAFGQGIFSIVRECARLAVEAFPQQRLPRLLEIDALLRTGRAREAVDVARRLVDVVAVDDGVGRKTLEAYLAAAMPTEPALALALPHCAPFPALQQESLHSALANTPADAIAYARPVLLDPTATVPLRLLAARALADAGDAAGCRRLLDAMPRDRQWTANEREDAALASAAWAGAAARNVPDADLAPRTEQLFARFDPRGTTGPTAMLETAAALEATHPRTAYTLCMRALATADPESRSGASHALAGRLAARLGMTPKAEEHWLAALAFRDGRAAASDLARLCIAQGRHERAMLVLRMVENQDDAALAAWAGDAATATTLAKAAVAADGLDLLGNATLAVLGQDSRVEWRDVAAPQREARLELLTLLAGRAFGAEAVERATALVASEPGSTTAQLLLARAHLLAGAVGEAARIHATLTDSGTPLLWRELALATRTPGYVLAKTNETALLGAMAAGATKDSTTATVCALQRIVDSVAATGNAEAAAPARALLWQEYPRDGFRVDVDLPALGALADDRLAWKVLEAALADRRTVLTSALRTQLLDLAFVRAEALVEDPATDARDFCAAAVRHIVEDGPQGRVVHFLLDLDTRAGDLQPDPAAIRHLLLGHLERIAAGRDDTTWLLRTVERLVRDHGPGTTSADLDALLRRFPTSVPLWRARAITLAHQQQAAAGLADLRTVLGHAHQPQETLAFVTLAAAEGVSRPDDLKLLDALPKDLLGSPAAQFARGLLYLRAGKPDEALPLLAKAPPQHDGLHLFALALACLQSRDARGGELARGHFAALARDYPSSELARSAGNFESQLAPR